MVYYVKVSATAAALVLQAVPQAYGYDSSLTTHSSLAMESKEKAKVYSILFVRRIKLNVGPTSVALSGLNGLQIHVRALANAPTNPKSREHRQGVLNRTAERTNGLRPRIPFFSNLQRPAPQKPPFVPSLRPFALVRRDPEKWAPHRAEQVAKAPQK